MVRPISKDILHGNVDDDLLVARRLRSAIFVEGHGDPLTDPPLFDVFPAFVAGDSPLLKGELEGVLQEPPHAFTRRIR